MAQDSLGKQLALILFTAFFLFSIVVVLWHREIYGLETRSALFVRDMLAGGSLMVPHLYGRPYTDYPCLFFIFQYVFSLPSGHVTALSISLPSALSASGLILLTWWFTKDHLREKVAFIATICLAALPEFWLKAQKATIDMLLALECSIAIVCLFQAEKAGRKQVSRAFNLFAYLSILAGVLTKGLVGLLPLFCWFLYLALQKRFMDILIAIPKWILISVAAICLEAMLFFKTGGIQLVEQAISSQFLSRIGGQPNKPFYYYFIYLALSFLPWILWILAQLSLMKRSSYTRTESQKVEGLDDNRLLPLLVAWSSGILIPYLLSASRHGRYILPAFMPLAIAMALPISRLTDMLDEEDVHRLLRGVFILSITAGIILLVLFVWNPFGSRRAFGALVLLSTMAFFCAWIGWRLEIDIRPFFLFAILMTYSTSAACLTIEPGISQKESAQEFAMCTEKSLSPGEKVILVGLKPDKNGIKYALFSTAYPKTLLFIQGPEGLENLSLPFVLVIPEKDLEIIAPFLSRHVTRILCQGSIHNRKVLSLKIISSKK